MIKNRRKSSTTARRAPARKPTRDDKNVGRQKATRTANLNARRGIQTSNKPSAMDIEREVYRQSRKNVPAASPAAAVATSFRRARRNPKDSAAQVKVRKVKKDQQQKPPAQKIVPVSVGGTQKPPSKTAITAAVEAMSSKGYNVPKGMQMVISFAPAAAPAPSKKTAAQKKKAAAANNNNNNKGSTNKSKGGGRKN
jgi:hypothetical protein